MSSPQIFSTPPMTSNGISFNNESTSGFLTIFRSTYVPE
ncbi:hypothetical protein T01_7973 [Trichinella spiralis]|uniref:Uncharacterized protein n=1 Tax=Trichinella spiralis TaxID=6334 RepID=A0A0V1AIX6_TRISP|nr:hypothetical protein T01_7973 [Trichinella spiralis]